jgi:beta-aspartyl-peptidase (threonine type)
VALILEPKNMMYFNTVLSILIFTFFTLTVFAQKDKITLVVHGGAGTILKENMTPELEKAYKDKLTEALQTGHRILQNGGTSLDAVVAVIKILEDSPLFNAGKGAVLTAEGKCELDAAIMDGSNLKAGSVAGVMTVKNPITLARKVMDKTEHVMLIGKGAERFAKLQGLEIVPNEYFQTENRKKSLKQLQEAEKNPKSEGQGAIEDFKDKKFGTVGCVALDQYGNLAAGTSTGGMTNKRYGRVGDAPIIGVGTYANNQTCAVSATGHGEFFIRSVVGYDISALMEYQKLSVKEASEKVVMDKLVKIGGEGGVIVLDRNGNFAMPFNSAGMYRGYIKADGTLGVAIYKE